MTLYEVRKLKPIQTDGTVVLPRPSAQDKVAVYAGSEVLIKFADLGPCRSCSRGIIPGL